MTRPTLRQRELVPGELRFVTLDEDAPVPLGITPWGMRARRAYRWDQIDEIEHRMVGLEGASMGDVRMIEGGEDVVPHSHVWAALSAGGVISGRGPITPSFESLPLLHRVYKDEARRPIALSFDGAGPTVGPATPGAFAELHRAATAFMASDRGRALLTTRADGYRSTSHSIEGEGVDWLRRKLVEAPLAADEGALCAIVAGELAVEPLIGDLCAVVSCPNALVAAACKAAALRLGAHPSRPGLLEEMRGFLEDGELELLWDWAFRSRPVR